MTLQHVRHHALGLVSTCHAWCRRPFAPQEYRGGEKSPVPWLDPRMRPGQPRCTHFSIAPKSLPHTRMQWERRTFGMGFCSVAARSNSFPLAPLLVLRCSILNTALKFSLNFPQLGPP